MCGLLGATGWFGIGLLYAAGVVTLPALKAGYAKIKAWIDAHK